MTTVRNAWFWVKIFSLYPLTFLTWMMLVPQILISNVSISWNIFGHIQKVRSGFWRFLLKAKLKLSDQVLISSFLIFLSTNLLLACFREPGLRWGGAHLHNLTSGPRLAAEVSVDQWEASIAHSRPIRGEHQARGRGSSKNHPPSAK